MAQDEPAPPDEPLSSVTEPSSVPAASEPPPSGAPPPPPPPPPLPPPPPTSSSSNSTTILYDRPTSIPNGAASHLRQNGSYSSSAAPEAKSLTDAGTGHNSDMSGGYYPPGGPDPHRSDHLTRQTPLPSPSPYSSVAAPTTSSRQHTPTPPSIPTIAPHPEDARYRHSAPPGSMTLPSMRTIDPLSQPQHHPRPLHRRASPLPRPPQTIEMHPTPATTPQNAPFYAQQQQQQQHPPIHSPNYGYTQDPTPRYAAPHDPHLLANRGPKKEIKRRTKTGCLTCRKRRIKCDETHPTCNNCKKSKRECLGYDPIFKQVSAGQPSNANLHPAASGSPAISSPHQPSSSVTSAASGPFQPGSRGSPNPLLGTPASTIASASPHWSNPPSRDPPAIRASSGHLQETAGIAGSRSLPPLTSLYDPRVAEQRSSSTYSSSADRRAQNMKIDDIITSLGPLPAAQQISHTENTFNEITNIYHEMYAPGLAAFFETSWYYFEENGKATFPKDTNLIEQMATFLKILEAVKVNDVAQMAYSGIFETKIVWELARTAYQSPDGTNSDLRFGLPPDGNPIEARNRLRVVDTLLTGEYLLVNPLAPPFQHPDTYRVRQHDFWYNLAEFVRKRDQPNSPASIQAREDILAKLRHLLDGRENRDVLYSIAVVRQLAPHYDPGYGSTIPQHLDETDPKHRLAVASKFILDEAQVTGGTTNVVRRFSDIASRAFVNPGVNVSRRA